MGGGKPGSSCSDLLDTYNIQMCQVAALQITRSPWRVNSVLAVQSWAKDTPTCSVSIRPLFSCMHRVQGLSTIARRQTPGYRCAKLQLHRSLGLPDAKDALTCCISIRHLFFCTQHV